jgi:hypothetical protein
MRCFFVALAVDSAGKDSVVVGALSLDILTFLDVSSSSELLEDPPGPELEVSTIFLFFAAFAMMGVWLSIILTFSDVSSFSEESLELESEVPTSFVFFATPAAVGALLSVVSTLLDVSSVSELLEESLETVSESSTFFLVFLAAFAVVGVLLAPLVTSDFVGLLAPIPGFPVLDSDEVDASAIKMLVYTVKK